MLVAGDRHFLAVKMSANEAFYPYRQASEPNGMALWTNSFDIQHD
jgi:hypothetical protein